MDKSIPYEDGQGNSYLLTLSNSNSFKDATEYNVINVGFQPNRNEELAIVPNFQAIHAFLNEHIAAFLEENPKSILFYIADNKPIFMNEARKKRNASLGV